MGTDVIIEQVPVLGTDNFSYLVFCPATGRAMGVDPGMSPESLLRAVRDQGVVLDLLVNTHGHRDHVGGNARVQQESGARLAAHPEDVPGADLPLADNDILRIGHFQVRVLHTPGHSPGSVCLYVKDAVITGDTLFVTRCGRADLPGGDPADLYRSLRRLAELPDETRVFPGHDYGPQPVSTIGFEKSHNPYLQCADLESFLTLRMG